MTSFDDGFYPIKNRKVKWTTVSRFKGLETDALVFVEIDKNVLLRDKLLFYVGASRARYYLDIVVEMEEAEVLEVLNHYHKGKKSKNSRKALATLINSMILQ